MGLVDPWLDKTNVPAVAKGMQAVDALIAPKREEVAQNIRGAADWAYDKMPQVAKDAYESYKSKRAEGEAIKSQQPAISGDSPFNNKLRAFMSGMGIKTAKDLDDRLEELISNMEPGGTPMFAGQVSNLFHGGAANIPKKGGFSLKRILTGEGDAIHGAGVNTTTNKALADVYEHKMAQENMDDMKGIWYNQWLQQHPEAAQADTPVASLYNFTLNKGTPEGYDKLIDLRKPMKAQPEILDILVQKNLVPRDAETLKSLERMTGFELKRWLLNHHYGLPNKIVTPEAGTEFIKYVDKELKLNKKLRKGGIHGQRDFKSEVVLPYDPKDLTIEYEDQLLKSGARKRIDNPKIEKPPR